jgi:phosphatidylinositol alpha-mannosyltransferase
MRRHRSGKWRDSAASPDAMRIALVSPYSWGYPGGVTRHVAALAEQFRRDGRFVRVLSPLDPCDRWSSVLHRGAEPQPLTLPDYLVPLGRTVGINANGAVSNLSITPHGVRTMLRDLRTNRYDVVHIHEPIAPLMGWIAATGAKLPLVGTFHAYSDKPVPNTIANVLGARRMLSRLHIRIAVSEAAAWTGRRWFGGTYRIIPNGVHVAPGPHPNPAQRRTSGRLRIVFVGQPVPRKGLPILLHAFAALRDRIPIELVMIGPSPRHVAALMPDLRGVRALGKIDDHAKQRELEQADVLCAPSLGGESFGMVLTEAFAAGIPVVASDIPGYRDVVRPGIDGLLVPPGDAHTLAEALNDLWAQSSRRLQMGHAATTGVARFAWPRVATAVLDAYHDAITTRSAPTHPARPRPVEMHCRYRGGVVTT